jgi:DNA polymerase II small subunit/DNA polymerase delta subunit B
MSEGVIDEDSDEDPSSRDCQSEFDQDQVCEQDDEWAMEPDDGNAQEQEVESELEEEEEEEQEETGKPAAATLALVVHAVQHQQQLGVYEDAEGTSTQIGHTGHDVLKFRPCSPKLAMHFMSLDSHRLQQLLATRPSGRPLTWIHGEPRLGE